MRKKGITFGNHIISLHFTNLESSGTVFYHYAWKKSFVINERIGVTSTFTTFFESSFYNGEERNGFKHCGRIPNVLGRTSSKWTKSSFGVMLFAILTQDGCILERHNKPYSKGFKGIFTISNQTWTEESIVI
jgi:hypothetical protein